MLNEQVRRSPTYEGTGTTGPFSFDFKVFDATQISVELTAAGAFAPRTLEASEYEAVLNEDGEGGQVTLAMPLQVGEKLSIVSAIPYDQPMGLSRMGSFNPDDLVTAWDRNCALIQQLLEKLRRAVLAPGNTDVNPWTIFAQIFQALKEAKEAAESAEQYAELCEEIKQYIEVYSWDIPHLVNSIRDVENYPYDGFFVVGGYGNPGHNGQNISNRYVKAEGSSELRTLGERFADIVNVKDFGAVGDGVHDDTEAIQAACDHAGALGFALIVFPHGSYKVTERIALPGNCSVNGFGSRILCSSSNGAFMVEGQGLGTQVALGSNATSGDTTITTASAHGLVAGDMALLWSQRDSLSEAAGDWRLGYHQGLKCYFAEPVSIQAVPSTTTVSLSNGLIFPGYRTDAVQDTGSGRTAATLAKLNFSENVTIRNFVIDHDGSGSAISAQYAKNFVVDNVVVNTGTSLDGVSGISLFACYGVRINGVSVFGDKTQQIETGDENFWRWTAVGVSSCWYVVVDDCHYGNVANGTDFTFYENYWCSMFCAMRNSFVVDATAVPSTSHPGVYANEFSNNTFVNCRTGLTIRSRAARITGNEFTKSKPSEEADERAIVLQSSAIDSIVSGNRISGYYIGIEDHAYSAGVGMLETHRNIYTQNVIKNVKVGFALTQGPQGNVDKVASVVTNNQIEFEASAVQCRQWRHGLCVYGNYLRGVTADDGTVPTCFYVSSDSTGHKFFNNMVENARLYTIQSGRTSSYYGDEVFDGNNNILFGYDIVVGSTTGYLNNSTYPKVGSLYNKVRISQSGSTVSVDGYPASALLGLEHAGGPIFGMVSTDGTGFPSINFYDGSLSIKASVQYGFTADRLNLAVSSGGGWFISSRSFSPQSDNTLSLGTGSTRVSEVFAATGAINTSDSRCKSSVASASDTLLDAWGAVPIHTFQFSDAVEKKGMDAARFHVGVVAQEVQEAFSQKGLDAARYGLFCHDEWQDEYETVEVVDQEEVIDDDGRVVTPRVTHTEQKLITPEGDRYGIRYEEALCLEAAYQRRRADRLEERLAALEKRMTIVEAQ